MSTVVVPYHLDQRLARFDAGLPADIELTVDLPAGNPWQRMAVVYEQVADWVSQRQMAPLVVSGDCTTSLGVLAGLQRAGREVGIVWFDAHADFHTERTSTSGYLGGFPLALAGSSPPTSRICSTRLPAVPRSSRSSAQCAGSTTGRVAAIGIAATWHPNSASSTAHQQLLRRLHEAIKN